MSNDGREKPAAEVHQLNVGPGGTGVVVRAPSGLPAVRNTLPERGGPRFVGRARELAAVAEALGTSGGTVVVLSGPPGVGKSELSIEHGRAHLAKYPGGTFFIRFDGRVPTDLAGLLPRLGAAALAAEAIEDQCLRALQLVAAERSLLVYDNVADDEMLRAWLPPAGSPADVIASSTSSDWPRYRKTITMGPLDVGDARELLLSFVSPEVAARHGDAILTRAEGLPVELCPLARSIQREVDHGRERAVERALSLDATTSFETAWALLSADARLLVRVASLFEPSRIPPTELSALLVPVPFRPERFDDALDAAIDRHQIQRSSESLRLHGLLAAFVAKQTGPAVPDEVARRHAERFIETAGRYSQHPNDAALRADFAVYPHVLDLWDALGGNVGDVLALGSAVVGSALENAGEYESALCWSVRALENASRPRAGVTEPAKVATALHQVGYCHSSLGRFDEALLWFERAVKEKEQGDVRVDHASLGQSVHQVGYCYASLGRFDEALFWFERAVKEKEQGDVHGRVDHASLGGSVHAVGTCHWSLRRFEEALPWLERAVKEAEQGDVHGRVDHENLGTSVHQLGYCHSSLGRFEEALLWFEGAVKEKEQGDMHGRVDHANLGGSVQGVGYCYSRLTRFDAALPWFERAVKEAEQGDVHGRVDHDDLGTSVHHVGYCHSTLGRFEEALPWFERAVKEKQQGDVHGRVDHENLGTSAHQAGNCHSSLGRFEEALPWFERAVKEKEQGDANRRVNHKSLVLSQTALERTRQQTRTAP